ncbi:MAG: hypothetical protein KF819_09785 [Labilithrix sp.]|nr:hypothetical protein [Labilithrix sp.]
MSAAEVFLTLSVLAAATIVVASVNRWRSRATAILVASIVGVAAAFAVARPVAGERPAVPSLPRRSIVSTYVSSAACRACHPSEHASFSRTFHRTMTQVATPRAVLAPTDGAPLIEGGRAHALVRRGDAVFAELPDPDVVARAALAKIRGTDPPSEQAADTTRRVVLTTGSHRQQAYWVAGAREGELRLFPFVWLVRERRFVPRSEAFLRPADAPMTPVRWSSSCIACHAVAGEPGHDPSRDAFDTRVAELGVACEACHGPGSEHVARYRDPLARVAQRGSGRADPTIVNPGKLDAERSAAVCGQCHSYAFPRDEDTWWSTGYARSYRPGDRLEPSRVLLGPESIGDPAGHAPVIEAEAASLFWPDGSIRVGGREYNGMIDSACWLRGEGEKKIACTSCHAMHRGDPAGQIAPDREGDRACTSCHDDARAREHGHHAPGSSGSACVSCHMPRTSYALLSAVRSHRIEIPSPANTARTGKPNACNLCHLDRSVAWSEQWLSTWYGSPASGAAVAGCEPDVASGVCFALAGDAAVRVIVADALGSPESAAASAPGFPAPVLAELVGDPYAAVRFVAERSLRAVSSRDDARLNPELVKRLLAARPDRAITIAE